MNAAEAAEQGFFARAGEDPQMIELLGGEGRVVSGWPGEQLSAKSCPQITFYVYAGPPRATDQLRLRIAVDEWIWPYGVRAGRPHLMRVDGRLEELFDEKHWEYGGHRLYALAGALTDYPGGPDQPLRRRREIVIEASPAA